MSQLTTPVAVANEAAEPIGVVTNQQPAPRRHRASDVVVIAALVLIGAAAVTLPLALAHRTQRPVGTTGPAARSGVRSSKVPTLKITPPSRRKAISSSIDQYAVNEAAWAGDADVASVTWVASTRGEADQAVLKAGAFASTTPVYVLEIPGSFTPNMPIDKGVSALSEAAVALVVVVNQATMTATDVGFMTQWASLTALGTPETDPLTTIHISD